MRNATYGTALTLMIGWLIWIGKPVLIPILAAAISVYVLSTAAQSMQGLPVLGRLPPWARRVLILLAFVLAVVLLFVLVINNIAQVAAALPRYESNLQALVTRFASLLGIEDEPTWANLRRATLDQVDFGSWIAPVLASLRGFGGTLFLVVLYASFFMAERGMMARKVVNALGGEEAGARALSLLARINERIGEYLFVKTAVNLILGVISYAIMLALGIEVRPVLGGADRLHELHSLYRLADRRDLSRASQSCTVRYAVDGGRGADVADGGAGSRRRLSGAAHDGPRLQPQPAGRACRTGVLGARCGACPVRSWRFR
jgi:predicted PurR-regulated permease PerM